MGVQAKAVKKLITFFSEISKEFDILILPCRLAVPHQHPAITKDAFVIVRPWLCHEHEFSLRVSLSSSYCTFAKVLCWKENNCEFYFFLPTSLGCSFNNTPQGRSLRDTTLWQTVRKNCQYNRFIDIVFCSWFVHANEVL